jgi:predicted RNA binding protein YcfA (HicA-like mRNA interferase family)
VIAILESLGFVVDAKRRGKYHVYAHPSLKGFGSNFACPHKSGDPVKNNYITGILSVLRIHEEALLKHLGGGK